MSMFKKVTASLFAGSMCLVIGVSAFAQAQTLRFQIDNTTYLADGVNQQMAAAPFIVDGRTMLPLDTVAQGLGAEADFDAAAGTIVITGNGVTLNLNVNQAVADSMGTPVVVDGVAFVPAAYVARALGADVEWDGDNWAVYISNPVAAQPTEAAPVEVYEDDNEEVPANDNDNDVVPAEDNDNEYTVADVNDNDSAAAVTAYELLSRAEAALAAYGSFISEMDMVIGMTFDLSGLDTEDMDAIELAVLEALAGGIEMRSSSVIEQVFHSEFEVDMRMETTTEVMGEEFVMTTYFRDGMFYMELFGDWLAIEMPLEIMLEQVSMVTFPEAAVLSQEVVDAGGETAIAFVLSGQAMTDMVDSMMDSLEAFGLDDMDMDVDMDMQISDVAVTVVIDSEGRLVHLTMFMEMTMAVDGLVIVMSMDIISEVVQFGNVTIDFPAVLDTL